MILVAFDCGLANTGYAVLDVGRASLQAVSLVTAGTFSTEKSSAKRHVLAGDDTTRRVRDLAGRIRDLCATHKPTLLAREAMSFVRHASSAAKLSASCAIVDTIAEVRGLGLVQASPQEVKHALCGRKDASKDDIAAAVRDRLGHDVAGLAMVLPMTRREHLYDACAVGLTCLSSEVVRALRGAA